ncbi:tetratricopeptide repeat protein [Vibrio astriarenae]|uniref:Tetratricopeptide repeat protein n=1 Tax=Vibrio astriarenae TaxID=1481923 RepID=A0A7Z2YGD4_9VIBR|nr:HEAT repeat domain-containing protein [Vibrio astriarenae]QIA66109.1 tetratricopeptide repeat protein [Vibrio astriarenae]
MKKFTLCLLVTLLSLSAMATPTAQGPLRAETVVAQDAPKDMSQLSYQAQDVRLSDEERAAALRALGQQPSQNGLVAVARALKDESPVLREAAVIGAAPYQLEHRWTMLSPLLNDEVKSVRLSAVMSLISGYSQLDDQQKADMRATITELKEFLPTQDDLDSQLLLADVLRWTGDYANAEVKYKKLLEQDPQRADLWLNLSDNYRAQHKDQKAVEILDQAILTIPENGDFHYAKSLALVRLDSRDLAAGEMEKATQLKPENSYYWYLNGVLQEPINLDNSVASFETAYMLSGSSEHLYALCDIYIRSDHDNSQVCLDALSQQAPPFVIEQLQAQMSN